MLIKEKEEIDKQRKRISKKEKSLEEDTQTILKHNFNI
jgi:hypothetical protein